MRTLILLITGGLITAVGLVASMPAQSQAQSQAKNPVTRGFDYWQPEWMVRELWGPGRMPKGMMVRLLRHTIYMDHGVPKNYSGAKSTIAIEPRSIAEGGKLYGANCASCHGADGMGSGDPGKAVSPSPALLAYMIKRPISVEEYLLWAIADGGEQFNSKMPAFKDKLSRDDIWRIVAYMRAGFPDVPASKK